MGRYIENSEWGAKNLVDFVLAVRQAMGAAAASVRYDSAQDLTSAQQETARSNIGAAGLSAPVFSDGITVSGGATISGGLTVNTTVTASAGVFSQYASATGFRALSYYALHRDANDDRLVVYGGKSTTEGGYLALYGKDHASAGKFTLAAVAGSGSACSLQGTWDGSLTWGGTITASTFSGTATSAVNASSLGGSAASVYEKVGHTHSYLPLAGGTLTGALTISRVNPYLFFVETDWSKGTPQSSNTSYQGIYFSGSNAEGGHVTYHYGQDKNSFLALTVQNLASASAEGNTTVYIENALGTKRLRPATNNDVSLGNANYKWSTVYATTFSGALAGNATTATTAASCTGNAATATTATKATNYISGTASAAIANIGGNAKTVRFPGGMQICYGSGTASTSSGCPVTFGSAFSETPTIMAIARPASKPTATHACHVVSGSTTGGTIWLIDGTTIRGGNIYWMAVGKWK